MQVSSLFFTWDNHLDNLALEGARESLTYRQLSRFIDLLAAQCSLRLDSRSAKPIVLLFDNNIEYVAAFLAALKISAVMPINPKLPLEQIVSVLAPLQPAILFHDAEHAPKAALLAADLNMDSYEVSLDAIFSCTEKNEPQNYVVTKRKEEDVALILHTSGTTAKPKCVPLTYKNLAESIKNIVATLQLSSADRNLNMMPLFHIHGIVASMLSTLASGGTLILKEIDYKDIGYQLKTDKPTWFTAVPTIHHKIYQELSKAEDKQDATSSLRFVRSCSSALSQALQQKLQVLLNVPIIQAYGMTEAAHQVASNPLQMDKTKLLSVGKPTGTVDIAILGEEGSFLECGTVGEVCIKGKNVFSGYWENPQANHDSFVREYFKTGDLGYLDEEGYLFLTGRKKELINKGGFKISPLQIDQIVLQHPGVSEAITFAMPHETLGDDIGLMVVPVSLISEQTIYEHLQEHLADYMLPSKIFVVDEIPKSATGKINRLSIFSLLPEKPTQSQPQNALEAELKNLWEKILMVPTVGVDDNFFQLGGNSLLAADLYRYLLDVHQIQLLPMAIYQSPTIAKMAKVILQHKTNREKDWLDGLEEIIKRYEAQSCIGMTQLRDATRES